MLWVVVFLLLALAALALLVGYAVWLAHKAADVLSEVGQLAEQGGQLADLLAQIELPEPGLAASNAQRAASGDVR